MYHLVGCGFVDYYYNLFDNDRVKLKDLYVSVAVLLLCY